MAAKGATFDNDLLNLIFKGTAIANIADNAASSPLTNLYVSLHTASPTAGGDQTSSECTFTSYAHVAVARGSGFTVTTNSVSPTAAVTFPAATGGSETAATGGSETATTGGSETATTGGSETATTGGSETATTGGSETATTGGSETATYMGIGTAASGAGKLLYWGPISPTIAI